MVRRFTRAVRVAEIAGAVAVVAVLAILFLPRLTGGGNAAPAVELPAAKASQGLLPERFHPAARAAMAAGALSGAIGA